MRSQKSHEYIYLGRSLKTTSALGTTINRFSWHSVEPLHTLCAILSLLFLPESSNNVSMNFKGYGENYEKLTFFTSVLSFFFFFFKRGPKKLNVKQTQNCADG